MDEGLWEEHSSSIDRILPIVVYLLYFNIYIYMCIYIYTIRRATLWDCRASGPLKEGSGTRPDLDLKSKMPRPSSPKP